MQTAGTALQLIGAVVAGFGLFYAWKRASARFDQWRNSVDQWRNSVISRLGALREQVTREGKADANLQGHGELNASVEVIRPGTLEDRLHRVENEVSALLGQAGTVNEATRAAIEDALAGFDANAKAFAVKDICWALLGIGLSGLGNLVTLVDKLLT